MKPLYLKAKKEVAQAGINMVDLMMWLVIAALLLAAAIQGIGYYQQNAYVYQMKEAADVAASRIIAISANDGSVDPEDADEVVAEENAATPNDQITLSVETVSSSAEGSNDFFELASASTATTVASGEVFYLRVTHEAVSKNDVVYFFKKTTNQKEGLHLVAKGANGTSSAAASPSPSPSSEPSAEPVAAYGLRQNELINPSAENDLYGWDNPGNRTTQVVSSEQAYSGTKSAKITYLGNDAADQAGTGTGAVALPASTTFTYTTWVYVPTGSPDVRLQIQIPFNTLATGTNSTKHDEWQQISVTFTTTTAQNYYLYLLNGESAPSGKHYYADARMLERTTEVRPFFDGSTPEGNGYVYSWSGVAHGSSSSATPKTSGTSAPTPPNTQSDAVTVSFGPRENELGNPSAESDLYGWDNPGNRATLTRVAEQAKSGTQSVKVVYNGSYAIDQVGTGAGANSLPGSTTYTYSKWVYVPSGSPSVHLQVQIPFNTIATSEPSTVKNQWQKLHVTFTTSSAQNYYLYTLNAESSMAGQHFYADAGMLEKADTVRPYFDGSTATDSFYTYSWTGTPHGSKSLATVK